MDTKDAADGRSRIRRSISHWANPARDEARELQHSTDESGCRRIADAPDREMVTVQGELRTLTLRPRGGVPALEAELYDGSGTVTVIWLGRRRIAGIEPGRKIKLSGRIGSQEQGRTLFNPRYELRP